MPGFVSFAMSSIRWVCCTGERRGAAYLPRYASRIAQWEGYRGKSSLFCASSLYTDMTYSKGVPLRSPETAVGLNSGAMSWFVPPLVVPALLAALLLAWIAYQAYS